MIYQIPPPEEPISQGDIIDNCAILFWDGSVGELQPATVRVRVIILTQACDLAQSKAERVLVAVVHNAQHLVDRGLLNPGLIRDHLRHHRIYGWYFLPAGDVLSESVVDLRDLHTLQRPMLEHGIKQGSRICRITTPYREHLAQHFATTYSRIGLPLPYETKAAT